MRVAIFLLLSAILSGCHDSRVEALAGPPETTTGVAPPPPPLRGDRSCTNVRCANGARRLSAGSEHTCFLREDGTLWCWGSNDSGQITAGQWNVYAGKTVPTLIGEFGSVLSVAAGEQHTCVLDASHQVHCFGAGWEGRLGGTDEPSVGSAEPVGLSNVESVAAGGGHTCAIDEQGGLFCWGDNRLGQLGLGIPTIGGPRPVKISLGVGVKTVSLGGYHSCALDEDRRVWCWGENTGLQLGVDAASTSEPALGGGLGCDRADSRCVNPTPIRIEALPPIARLAVGFGHSCAIDVDGAVWCWGFAQRGAVGPIDSNQTQGVLPRRIEGIGPSRAVAVGGDHTCVISDEQRVWCWGTNTEYQLGPSAGSATIAWAPVQVEHVGQAVELALGQGHSCALTEDDTVYCWGSNLKGELGIGTEARQTKPPPGSVVLENATGVSARGHQACATTIQDRAYCWGASSAGEIGGGAFRPASVPTEVVGLPSARRIQTSGAHACAISGDFRVFCWGDNFLGRALPQGGGRIQEPTEIPGLLATEIALGSEHSCALDLDARVSCWGDNSAGQLGSDVQHGDGLLNVTGVHDARAVVAYGATTCAILGDETLICWGGGLGAAGPTLVPHLEHVRQAVLGYAHGCALQEGGRVLCWGANDRGQLGDGCRDYLPGCRARSDTPLEVQDIPPMIALAAGGMDTCGIGVDATLWCWGHSYGAPVQTSSGFRFKPSRIDPAPINPVELELGDGRFVCAKGADKSIRCWGDNEFGQRGNGERFVTSPILIHLP